MLYWSYLGWLLAFIQYIWNRSASLIWAYLLLMSWNVYNIVKVMILQIIWVLIKVWRPFFNRLTRTQSSSLSTMILLLFLWLLWITHSHEVFQGHMLCSNIHEISFAELIFVFFIVVIWDIVILSQFLLFGHLLVFRVLVLLVRDLFLRLLLRYLKLWLRFYNRDWFWVAWSTFQLIHENLFKMCPFYFWVDLLLRKILAYGFHLGNLLVQFLHLLLLELILLKHLGLILKCCLKHV